MQNDELIKDVTESEAARNAETRQQPGAHAKGVQPHDAATGLNAESQRETGSSPEPSRNFQTAPKSLENGRKVPRAPDASAKIRKISVVFEGLDYLFFSQIMDRYVFDLENEKDKKDKKEQVQSIIYTALHCLKERMDDISDETGSPFVLESDILPTIKADLSVTQYRKDLLGFDSDTSHTRTSGDQ